MIAVITPPATAPAEGNAKVNNVIPLSLVLGFTHQSRRLINIVCSHARAHTHTKRCDAFVPN